MHTQSRTNHIGLILLAAGASGRMGTPKQLLDFKGKSLIQHILTEIEQSLCLHTLVVTGANQNLLKENIKGYNINIVENNNWEKGLSSSIKVGINKMLKLYPKISGIIIVLCDQPKVKAEHINQLIDVYSKEEKTEIVASAYNGTFGVPALFSPSTFKDIMQLEGDIGAKHVIQEYRNKRVVTLVNLPEASIDIDTPEDYDNLE